MRESALKLRDLAYLDEHHIWYVLDLDRVERLPLAEGYEVRLASEVDVELIAQMDTLSVEDARQRYSEGVQLWLVLQGTAPAFSCWIYRREAPVRAAASRHLKLPPGVACLEDSFTDAAHRGRRIAGAAWTEIALQLGRQDYKVLITKVAVENVPSRKAVERAGFRAASVMDLRHRGPRENVHVTQQAETLTAAEQEAADNLKRSLTR